MIMSRSSALIIPFDTDPPSVPRGLPIAEQIVSGGVKVLVAAEGVAAVRCENGEVAALACAALSRIEGPGISLSLEKPEDITNA